MLIVTRKAGEFIQVGENIQLHVIRCSGGQVKIGIDAPPEVLILRGELLPHEDNRHE